MANRPTRASDAGKKKPTKKADPSKLIRSGKGADIALSEEDLKRVVGGGGIYAKKGA